MDPTRTHHVARLTAALAQVRDALYHGIYTEWEARHREAAILREAASLGIGTQSLGALIER